jgi:hypothetical protein
LVSASSGDHLGRRLVWALAGVLTVMLLAGSYLPVHPYMAYCPGQELWIRGPFRERFVWILSKELSTYGIRHIIYNNNIYPFGWRGSELYHELNADFFDFQLNTDWKLAASIRWGVEIDDVRFPPPERLVALIREIDAKHGPFPKRDGDGNLLVGTDEPFADYCELFKAAVLPESAFAEEGGKKLQLGQP